MTRKTPVAATGKSAKHENATDGRKDGSIGCGGQYGAAGGTDRHRKKAVVKNQQTNAPLEEITELAVRDILNDREKISGRKVPEGKVIQTLRGVKRVKDAGGNKALQGLSLDALLKAGEKDISDEELAKIAARENNALAKKILEKSGQDVKRRRKKDVKKFPDKTKDKANVLLKRNLSLKNLNDRV